MRLRKQPPPRLQNIGYPNIRSEARSPKPASASSVSPSRAAYLKRVPSAESVYSPDLNTSPAFNLMPLEEAQRSPVGSPAHPSTSWPDGAKRSEHGAVNQYTQHDQHNGTHQDIRDNPQSSNPPFPYPNTGESENVWQTGPRISAASTEELSLPLQSNNPFLNPRSAEHTHEPHDQNEWARASRATTDSAALSHTDGYIPMTARLSLVEGQESEAAWGEPQPTSDHRAVLGGHHLDENSPWESQKPTIVSAPDETFVNGRNANPYTSPLIVDSASSEWADGRESQSFNTGKRESDARVNIAPVTPSYATSAISHQLIDLDNHEPTNNREVEPLSRAGSSMYSDPSYVEAKPTAEPQPSSTAQSAFDHKGFGVQSLPLSPEEAARQMEQRSETYAIRHVRWTNARGELLESPILVQNKNGPCPLLALINALIISANPKTQPPIVRALSTREHISLGLLIEAMFEELTTCISFEDEFPDIEALAQFLTMLHTGMNVNPRLTLESIDGVGTFFETSNLRLYSTFGIPLIHAWLAAWSSPTDAAMSRTGQYYDDIQLLPFRRQELEDRATRGEQLSYKEDSDLQDIQMIQEFTEVDNATQLSPFGLTQLSTKLAPGSVSILFRNDHFSTLYKHPQSHQLYTLVTDAGYASHAEVVWESLVDVTGFNTEYYSGDFRPVGAGSSVQSAQSDAAGPQTSNLTADTSLDSNHRASSQSTDHSQEQSDADYAFALSLQFEEEQRQNSRPQDERGRTSVSGNPSNNRIMPAGTRDAPYRSSNTATRSGAQPYRGPDSDNSNAPPPPYEQAAGGPRYSSPSRRPYRGAQGSQYPGRNAGPNVPSSAHRPRPSASSGPDRMSRERNKDCIVM